MGLLLAIGVAFTTLTLVVLGSKMLGIGLDNAYELGSREFPDEFPPKIETEVEDENQQVLVDTLFLTVLINRTDPINIGSILAGVMEMVGRVRGFDDIDPSKLFKVDMWTRFPKGIEVKIMGMGVPNPLNLFPIDDSENITYSAKKTTWPKVILSLLIDILIVVIIIKFGPKVWNIVKPFFVQILGTTITTTIALNAWQKEQAWKDELREILHRIESNGDLLANLSQDDLALSRELLANVGVKLSIL